MGFFKNIIKSTSPIAGAIIDAIDSNQSEEYIDDKITFEGIFGEANELADADLYDEAIEKLEEAKNLELFESDTDFWIFYYKKAQFLYRKSNYIMQGIDYSDDNYDEYCNERKSLVLQASLNLEQASKYVEAKYQECAILALRAVTDYDKNKGGARRYLIGALGTDDEEFKAEYLEQYESCTQSMKENFEEYKKQTMNGNKKHLNVVAQKKNLMKLSQCFKS